MPDSARSPLGEPTPLPPAIEARLDEYRTALLSEGERHVQFRRSGVSDGYSIAQSKAESARAALSTEIGKALNDAREDSARLDYLQDASCNVSAVMEMDPESEVGFIVRPYNDNEMPGATLRDAIDACRFGECAEVDLPREFPPRPPAPRTAQ